MSIDFGGFEPLATSLIKYEKIMEKTSPLQITLDFLELIEQKMLKPNLKKNVFHVFYVVTVAIFQR